MNCWVCLGPLARGRYHPRCARRLFGSSKPPLIDVDMAKLTTLALAMAGRTSMSGVQQKLGLGFSSDRTRLQVVTDFGAYILKPPQRTFDELPENEHLTMQLAALAGDDIPPCGLVELADGRRAYLVSRFDRVPAAHRKRPVEDFCQLAGLYPGQKYDGSGEQCVRLLRSYASEPLIEVRKLFLRLAFAWWVGNGDLHLKNLSLVRTDDGIYRLSPSYDLVATRLVIPTDAMAMTIGGRREGLTRAEWLRFAEYARLPRVVAAQILDGLATTSDDACALVGRSLLSQGAKTELCALLRARADTPSK